MKRIILRMPSRRSLRLGHKSVDKTITLEKMLIHLFQKGKDKKLLIISLTNTSQLFSFFGVVSSKLGFEFLLNKSNEVRLF